MDKHLRKIKNTSFIINLVLFILYIFLGIKHSNINSNYFLGSIIVPSILIISILFSIFKSDKDKIKYSITAIFLSIGNLFIYIFDTLLNYSVFRVPEFILNLNFYIFILMFLLSVVVFITLTKSTENKVKKQRSINTYINVGFTVILVALVIIVIYISTICMLFLNGSRLAQIITLIFINNSYIINNLFIIILKLIPIITFILAFLINKLLYKKLNIKINKTIIFLVIYIIILGIVYSILY